MRRGPHRDASTLLLRMLQVLALAIVTVVPAGIIQPNVAMASVELTVCARATPAPPARQWREGTERPADDLDVAEVDLDDDDIDGGDPLSKVFGHAVAAFRRIDASSVLGRFSRGESSSDTSRFALRSGLPRGPPPRS